MKSEEKRKEKYSSNTIILAENSIILAVSLSLFGGRWISYIGLPTYNLFVIDLMYFLGIFYLFLFQEKPFNTKSNFATSILLITFILIQLTRNSNLSFAIRFRDLVPYIYLVSTPVIINKFSIAGWVRAIRFVRIATVLGAFWTDLVMIGWLKEILLPQSFAGVPIFSARWDHSGISMCIGLILWGSFPKANLKENDFIRLFLLLSVLIQYSRASYVGLTFTLIALYFAKKTKRMDHRDSDTRRFKTVMVFIVIFIPTLTLLGPQIPQNSGLNRIGINNLLSPGKLVSETRNSGTANARIEAQKLLSDWTFDNNFEYFGAGPGREMVLESNAVRYLSGARDVRSPHSWLYGNFGRYGFCGLLIWHMICFNFLRAQKRSIKMNQFPEIILVPIYLISLFGVIMESPFGILPFSFFLGSAKIMSLSHAD